MSFETALRKRLLDDAAVRAIVSTRVDWSLRPQGDPYPSVVLTLVSDPRPQHLNGFHPLRETRVQIDCYAAHDKPAQAVALRDAVIDAISTPRVKLGGVRFDRVRINNVLERGDQTETGTFVHRQLIDASFWQGKTE